MTINNKFTSLIEQMQQPEFYPHRVQEPIKLIHTHASLVSLTGEYAYKLKKTVDFGFLDFSTLAKRKYFLEEELRLNQPIAPDIYLEVLPITEAHNKFVLSGSGAVAEYALKMCQFPQQALFITLFETGELTEFHLKELGKIVASFHINAQTNDYIKRFGAINKIREAVAENYQQTEKYINVAQTQKQYDETKKFTDSFLLENKVIFEKRIDNDKIKECHGDLHLKNICFWQNKIQLFDRIEFNEFFRFVDVMYDVAFTVMDLDARGRKDFGNLFLNTYLEQTGDWKGLQVLPFYLSRQAYVRAKVTSLLLDDPRISEAAKQEAIQNATNYYHLAWEYTQPTQGRLFLMSGLSGSGKTTVAQQLARRLNAIHIRSDAVRKHLAGIALEQKGETELYTPQMTQKTYECLLELGIELATAGFPVILDAKFDRKIWREKAIALAQAHQLPLQILQCNAPIEVLRDRLSHRHQDISDATPDLLTQQQSTTEPFTEKEQAYVVTIETAQANWASQLNLYL